MSTGAPAGVLVVDKPGGMTSHDVVNRVRRAFGTKQVGHAGTLDPMATGVLVVCLGDATRVIEYLDTEPKEYVAGVVFGVTTDSQDTTGQVVEERGSVGLTREALEDVLTRFRGELQQVPPMVSAVHHEGKRLYELARRGVEVERAARAITVHSLTLEGFEPGDRASAMLRVVCSSGTYVRALAHDIGAALGCGGAMCSLRRTRVGRYGVEGACSVEAIVGADARSCVVVSIAEALSHLPSAALDESGLDRIAHGQDVEAPPAWPADALGVFLDPSGQAVAVGRRAAGRLQPNKVFAAALAERMAAQRSS